MTVSSSPGPIIIWGTNQPVGTGLVAISDSNPDLGYTGIAVGSGLVDPRYGYQGGIATTSTAAVVIPEGGEYHLIDQAPSAIATANIAALANAVSGTPQTLVSSTGAGITVMATALTILQTGKTIPAGALAIDGIPAMIQTGQNKTIMIPDARTCLTRAVSITGVASGTGGAFKVSGADLYGMPQTETITATGGATTTNGKKAWKFIFSVTPQFSDAHNYSVGTTDIYGLPMRVDEWAFITLMWNNTWIVASTGFVVADTTSPATATTGDVRGTYATQDASNGTKKLQVFISVAPWNAATVAGIFGVTPA